MIEEKDTYQTIKAIADSTFTEKKSKFLSFAIPVLTQDEVKEQLVLYQKKYYDARHVCYAYRLGYVGEDFRANDNGEPSGTAGKPILGQMKSFDVTNVLIVVIRYFGGIKLGTGGLISAYREAAKDVLNEAEIITKTINESFTIVFEYPFLSEIMRIVKDDGPEILEQKYDNDCEITLRIRKLKVQGLKEKLLKVETAHMKE